MADYSSYMYISYIYMVYTLLEYTTGLDITVCRNDGNFPSADLNCSNNDTIHVESIRYFYKQGSDCSGSTVPCGLPLTNSDTGLTTTCNGQSACSQFIPNTGNCTGSTVNYRCIPRENSQDMCQIKINLTENAGRLFLFSPNYPTATNGFEGNEPSCRCSIRGTPITAVTILNLRLQTGSDGTRSNLFIQYGDITYNKTSRENPQSNLQLYNHRLQSTSPSTTADIIFSHQQIHGQKLWIEIQGIALAGFCNKAATNVSPRPTTPFTSPPQSDSTITTGTASNQSGSFTSAATHPTTATNTESSTTTDPSTSSDRSTETSVISPPAINPSDSGAQQTDNDKDIIIIALATILSLSMIVAIVLFLVYRKGKLKCQNRPSNPGTGNSRTITPAEPSTTYSNLSDTDRNNTDSSYQELQTRNSNSPYNNLPYSGTDIEPGTNYNNLPYSGTDIEPGTNYSSLSDGNRLTADNNNYLQLETRTTTSPYNNLPYTSEHHTYSNQ